MNDRINSNLIDANIKLQDENNMLKTDNKMLETRIKKAIKYIEDELWEVGGQVNGSDLPYDKAIQPLLDILKG